MSAAELAKLLDAAVREDRNALQQLLNEHFSLSRKDRTRLETELIQTASRNSTTPESSASQGPLRHEIIRQLHMVVAATASPPLRWQLEVKPSSASSSGDGVFLRGACAADSVLAVYPGVAYTTVDLPSAAKTVLEDNHYTLFLRNGVILDAKPDGPSRAAFDAAWQRDLDNSHCTPLKASALAVAHKVNHPPKGVPPNTYLVPLDLGFDEDVALHAHLHVVNARADEPFRRTAVLVSSRALCNEELWLDYKLCESAHRLPEWFTPCSSVEGGDAATYYY